MWAKICGITTAENGASVIRAGADAIGLNFYPKSKRYVSPVVASDITQNVIRTARQQNIVEPDVVGLFVNATVDQIVQTTEDVQLSAVQLHGDEPASLVAAVASELPEISLIRAFRVSDANLQPTLAQIRSLLELVPNLTVLLDTLVDGHYGGTGHMISAGVLKELHQLNANSRLVLAGGLTPSNLERLFDEIQPWGVDTASGVETEPGIKDASLVKTFVQIAHRGIQSESPVRLSSNR